MENQSGREHSLEESYNILKGTNSDNHSIIGILDYMSERITADPLLPFYNSSNIWREPPKVPFTVGNLLSLKNVSLQTDSSEWKKAKKVDKKIHDGIMEERKRRQDEGPILVTGGEQSGKTTFLKQIKINNRDISVLDRRLYQPKFFYLCMSEMLSIVEEMKSSNIELSPSTSLLVKQLLSSKTTDTKVLSEWIQELASCPDVQQYMTAYSSDHPSKGYIRTFFLTQLQYLQLCEPDDKTILLFPDSWFRFKEERSSRRRLVTPTELTVSPKDFSTMLPQEIIIHICSFLDFGSLKSLAHVNKRLAQVFSGDSNLWIHLLRKHFSALSTRALIAKEMFTFLYKSRKDQAIIRQAKLLSEKNSRFYCVDSRSLLLWKRKGFIDLNPKSVFILFDATLCFHSDSDKFEEELSSSASILDYFTDAILIVVLNKFDLAEKMWKEGKQPHFELTIDESNDGERESLLAFGSAFSETFRAVLEQKRKQQFTNWRNLHVVFYTTYEDVYFKIMEITKISFVRID